ncbi:hypothetical protein [Cellulosilyticum ruminicola]|uniref:hypothetical protein n=1 Tax=Cellulosilyticum ruminicola TaxID=425254 RepID=UPI0006D1BA01|nr:hypothetical protein [Cellulosilyticum ruminicola]
MSRGYFLLIVLCVLGIYVLLLNLSVIKGNKFTVLRQVCSILLIFSITRYMTLVAYGDHLEFSTLMKLRYFYFATSIGLTIPTASALWYITPLYREKIKYPYYLLCFLPWILFYTYLIVRQPTQIIQGSRYGYVLQLTGSFPLYLSIVQGSFIAVIIVLSIIGLVRYKNIQLRVEYIILILAQITLILDGLGYYIGGARVFPSFTASEILGFAAIYYTFKVPIIEIKGIQSN